MLPGESAGAEVGSDVESASTSVDPQDRSEGNQTKQMSIPAGESDGSKPSIVGVVRLLHATRVPAHYRKMVRVKAEGWRHTELSLFTPEDVMPDLVMADAMLQMERGDCATILVENHSDSPMQLEKGMTLGSLEPVEQEEVGVETMVPDPGDEDGEVAALLPSPEDGEAETSDQDRMKMLTSQLNPDLEHLTETEQQSLKQLLADYADVFALNPSELGTTSLVTHTIDTGDHSPVRQPVRRMPFALRKQVDQMVQEMIQDGVIQPSRSPWASPVVLVKKKDGKMRFCVDYRHLNRLTKLDVFPLPRIDDTLAMLSGAKYFTTLDLASGYWQVAMDPESQEKTAFNTYSGLYEFRKMPFGLVNAPATFQRLMEVVLHGLARRGCLDYLDDIIVIGRTLEEHNINLINVLQRLRKAFLKLKPPKCKIAQLEVEYLGHIVSQEGIRTDPKKLQAVKEFPLPGNVKTLRSFLGLASYYRRFIPDFARIATPLHALTKKEVEFLWDDQCQMAFEELQTRLTAAPVLAFPNFEVPFRLETDASGHGLGAVLAQQQKGGSIRPIAYASRTLQPHEKKYGVTELEGLGVVWAVKHFRPYLYGHPCDLYTDHPALKSLLNTTQPSGKLARWGMAIQELDIHIHHRNSNADALSRHPLQEADPGVQCGVVAAVESTRPEEELASWQRQDQPLNEIIVFLETGCLPQDEKRARVIALTQSQYTLKGRVLYHLESDGSLRVIPPEKSRKNLFDGAHGGTFGAHLRDAKVFSELQRHYWWLGMRSDIARWSRGCLVCATHSTGRAVHPPLTPIPVAGPFDRVGVDVIQFPRSWDGNQYAVVFVDYLTKWPEVFAVPDQSAATIAKLLVEEIVSRHGVPAELLSDRGAAFLSGLMDEVREGS